MKSSLRTLVDSVLTEDFPEGQPEDPAWPRPSPGDPDANIPLSVDDGDDEVEDQDLIELWCEQNRVHRWEGETGVRNLDKLVRELGYTYDGIREFLGDNPGAVEGIVEFIKEWMGRTKSDSDGWYARLKDATTMEGEGGPEEEEGRPGLEGGFGR
jgi:hypothetical protein